MGTRPVDARTYHQEKLTPTPVCTLALLYIL